ncbi:MAG TPA: DEAD/DEAH box helicase family protein [Solirubrobacteraceae bacterium]|nr:DEAD/DEAH box helicase family protein [Solirubrobacteraceae bacterium]
MAGPLEKDTCRDYVLPRLKEAGWSDDQIQEQFRITDGRVVAVGKKHRRGDALRADYVLEYRPGVPVAVVEAKREYAIPGNGLQQAKDYARLLDLPFSYSTNADGSVKEPRYYQQTAINSSVAAILGGKKRLLLTMATGTGKTFVSMQIVWKLWRSGWRPGRNPRVLYLADRNILIDQPQSGYFVPAFGEGPVWKLSGEAKAGRELYFALYQALADGGGEPNGIFRQFDPDFFDLVIVDECHRGSANAESSWRAILEYFSPATQLGMTATPKREETVDSYEYFGEPLFEYSLAQGIDDGFLAPYRVRRVVLSPDAHGWEPTPEQLDRFGKEIPPGLYTTKEFERVVSLLTRTEEAARHLTKWMSSTDRWAKTVVFCVDQEHADQMRRALHNANADLTRQYPNHVVRIVSEERDIGKGYLSDFAGLLTIRQLRSRAEALDAKAALYIERAIHRIAKP